MRKTYILDTSSLIDNPYIFKNYSHSDIIIPIATITELDDLKKQPNETGRNARVCIRILDELSEKGDISVGILIDDDILIKIDTRYNDPADFPGFGDDNYGDTHILICAYLSWKEHPTKDVTLLSNDINLRLKAKARGLESLASQNNKKNTTDFYSGLQIIENEEIGTILKENSYIDPGDYNLDLYPHECVLFKNKEGQEVALGRKILDNKIKIIKNAYPWGINAKNSEQRCAINLIMDKNIDLVTMTGIAGSGKSLLALSTSLELVLGKKEYDRLLVYKPIQTVGNDIGFIPGTIEEKLGPHFSSIMDAFEFLLGSKGSTSWKKDLEMFQKKGQVSLEAITYIRGRSINRAIIFIDEAQNLTKEDIKTLLTRAGEDTKIILSGDTSQIDAPKLDQTNNGLSYVIEKFKNSNIAGHITLVSGERSRLATLAAELL